MKRTDVLIIGAGAAGLMCAATAGYRGRRVVVLDHAPKPAAKIRISGGGKCNFTNLNVTPAHYYCRNPHFVKSALSRFTNEDFIALVARHGVEYEVREHGRLFCRHRATDITKMLLTECDWAGVARHQRCGVEQVVPLDGGGFEVVSGCGRWCCESLVIATGALSFPKLRATDFGHRLAERLGLEVVPTRPGLVPLVMNERWRARYGALSGLSLPARVRCGEVAFEEPVLITHTGLSGPGILQISNVWREGEAIELDLFPQVALDDALLALKRSGRSLHAWLKRQLPRRFAQTWLEHQRWPDQLSAMTDEAVRQLASRLRRWRLHPEATAGYDRAEVTLGGVATEQLSSKTMMARSVPGLYFVGEVMDVTGQLGGYNFQWAWSSGYAAGCFA